MSNVVCSILCYIKKTSSAKSVASNTLCSLLVRTGTLATRLIVLFLIAKLLSPNLFGVIAYSFSITEIARVLADFGLDTLSIRAIAISDGDKNEIISNIGIMKLINSFSMYLLLVIYYAFYLNGKFLEIGSIVSLLMITSVLTNLPISYFQATLRTHKLLFFSISAFVVTIVAELISIIILQNVILSLVILPFSELILLIGLITVMLKEVKPRWRHVSLSQMWHIWSKALPIGITLMLVIIYTRVDVLALTHFADMAAVGIYSIAFRLTEPFQFIANAFSISVYSHVSAVRSRLKGSIQKVVRKYLISSLTYGLVTAFMIVLLFPVLVQHIYPQYLGAVPIVKLLAFALIFRSLNTSLTAIIQAHGYFSRITAVAFWNLTLICVLLAILTPKYGPRGAAAALLIAEMINSIIQFYMGRTILTSGIEKFRKEFQDSSTVKV